MPLNRLLALLMAALLFHAAGPSTAFAQTAPQHKGTRGGGGLPGKPPGRTAPPVAAAPAPVARAPSAPPPQAAPQHREARKPNNGAKIGIGIAAGILATILAAEAAKSAQAGPPPRRYEEDPMSRQCRRWDRLCEDEGARWACRRLERDCN